MSPRNKPERRTANRRPRRAAVNFERLGSDQLERRLLLDGGSLVPAAETLTIDSIVDLPPLRVMAQFADFTYSIANGQVTITGYTGTGGAIAIPEQIEGLAVTSIGARCFESQRNLSSVFIPNTVTSIGSSAFRDCTGLTSITIPRSVTSIGSSAFSGCAGLFAITIPNKSLYSAFAGLSLASVHLIIPEGTTVIADSAYSNWPQLTSVTIPDSVTSIGSSAFSGCTGLTSITIPTSVTSIGSSAFRDCTGLTSITIPRSVTSIGSSAFSGCAGLFAITIPNKSLYSAFAGLSLASVHLIIPEGTTVIADSAYSNWPQLTSVTIPDSVTSIGSSAFSGCTGLTSITIPAGVTSIGASAFSTCTGLTSITIPSRVTSIGSGAFSGCTGLTAVTIPNKGLYSAFSPLSLASVHLRIPEGTTVIADSAYSNWPQLASVTIPDSVTSIGWGAFSGCTGLTSITIPTSVTSIGADAFRDCRGLTSITIPSRVTSIGWYAFSGCTGLTAITIPNKGVYSAFSDLSLASVHLRIPEGTTVIADSAYSNWPKLTSVTIPDSVTSIGRYAFSGCTGLTSITIPTSVMSIGADAFRDCRGLTSITVPSRVTSIGYGAFSGCTGLTAITVPNKSLYSAFSDLSLASVHLRIPEGTTAIADSAYWSWPQLTSVTIPDSVTSIGWDAFSGCTGLTSIAIPSRVTSIRSSAFSGCTGLAAVTIPNKGLYSAFSTLSLASVHLRIPEGTTVIANSAYSNWPQLTSVTIPDSVTSIGSSAFSGCTGLTSITIPTSVTSIGSSAFRDCTDLTSITIPSRVTSIGSGAFSGCTGLTAITIPSKGVYSAFSDLSLASVHLRIPEGTTVIADSAYSNWPQLTSVTIPDTVTSIGWDAFSGCTRLTSITIPTSVTSIGSNAFSGCRGLNSITIPSRVTSIGYGAFSGCTGLTAITVPNKSLYSAFSTLSLASVHLRIPEGTTVIAVSAYSNWPKLTSVTIPDSVTSIGWGAFSGCTGLTSITIPTSVTSIGSDAFRDCTGLTSITIPSRVTSIGSGAFSGCTGLTAITIPNKGVYSAFSDLSLASVHLRIPEGTTAIADSAYSNWPQLTSVTIPDSVTSIGRYAFSGCTGLTSITIPTSVTSIGSNAFSGCRGLTSITIPSRVTSIGSGAFSGCTGLTAVTIPNKSLYSAFAGLSLASVHLRIPEGTTAIVDSAYSNWSQLTSVTIPDSVTSIGWDAFSGCTRLTSIAIPSRVTSIQSSAFSGCTGLTAVTIPNKGLYSAFSPLSLASVHLRIPEGTTVIADSAYSNWPKLTSVTIPDSVTSIGRYAFSGCTGLTSITIPTSVTSIRSDAFSGCTGLTSIYCHGNAPVLQSSFVSTPAIIYYRLESTGWSSTFAGRPTATFQPYDVAAGETLTGAPSAGVSRVLKQGEGTLVLRAAASLFNGTVVEAGELVADTGNALGTGPLIIENDGVFRVAGTGTEVQASQLQLAPQGRINVGKGSVRLRAGGYDQVAIEAALADGRLTADSAGLVTFTIEQTSGDAVVRFVTNAPPSAVALANVRQSLPENTSTAEPIRVADIVIIDDAEGLNTVTLTGADAAFFEVTASVGDRLAATLNLKAGTSLNFETKASYSVTVQVADAAATGSVPATVTFTLAVTNVNEIPTNIALSATTIAENAGDNAVVGTLSTTDPDVPNTFTYTLVTGTGSTDNAAFNISGNQLRATKNLDFEAKSSYSLRVRSTDQGGLFTEKEFTITVTNVNEAPASVALVNTVSSLPESTSTAERIRVADIVMADDALGTNVITLTGADAAFFEVVESDSDRLAATLFLRAGTILDAHAKPAMTVTVLAGDAAVVGMVSDATATFTLMVESAEELTSVTVTGIYVRGTSWATGYLARSPFTTVEGAALGWRLPDGSAQLTEASTVSWSNVDVISVRFDQPIAQPAADALQLVLGTAGGNQTIVSASAPVLLAGGTVAQWTLPAALATGRYVISIAAAGITNANGTATLDGEWTTSTSAFATGSGDGVAGGTFNFFFNVLIGNVNGDLTANVGDINAIRNRFASPLGTPLPSDSDHRLDVDGSNTLTVADITQIRNALASALGTPLSSLPQVTPPVERSARLVVARAAEGERTSATGLLAEAWAWYAIEDALRHTATRYS